MQCTQQPMGWFLRHVLVLMPTRELATNDRQHDELETGHGKPGTPLLIFIVFVITVVFGITNILPIIHPTG